MRSWWRQHQDPTNTKCRQIEPLTSSYWSWWLSPHDDMYDDEYCNGYIAACPTPFLVLKVHPKFCSTSHPCFLVQPPSNARMVKMMIRGPFKKKIRDYLGVFPQVDTMEKLPNNPVFFLVWRLPLECSGELLSGIALLLLLPKPWSLHFQADGPSKVLFPSSRWSFQGHQKFALIQRMHTESINFVTFRWENGVII